jgi:hypothetical protein
MLDSTRVITFGLSFEQNQTVAVLAEAVKARLMQGSSHRDLIEQDYFFAIVDSAALTDQATQDLMDFYGKVDGNLCVKVYIGRLSSLAQAAHALVFPTFACGEGKLAGLIKKAVVKARDEENTINHLRHAITLNEAFNLKERFTTDELALIIGQREAAVRRYMEALRIMGRPLHYDAISGMWVKDSMR